MSPQELRKAADTILRAHGGTAPCVLDLFAGGGSIPLEASRLGCRSFAVELNPVAHVVQLATLSYPARFGRALVTEVRRTADSVFRRARLDIAGLYPSLADPKPVNAELSSGQKILTQDEDDPGRLTPVAYLWTRTVSCMKCGAPVPLHRQTWLRRKPGGFVALKPVADPAERRVVYELLESDAKDEKKAVASWEFDPTDLSSGGETSCLFCPTAVPTAYIKTSSKEGKIGLRLMAVIAVRAGARGKV